MPKPLDFMGVGVKAEDVNTKSIIGSDQLVHDEDGDLFNIDEDDVDMLNKQIEVDEYVPFRKSCSNAAVDLQFNSKNSDENVSVSDASVGSGLLHESINVSSISKSSADNEGLPMEKDNKKVAEACSLKCTLCLNNTEMKRGQLLDHLTVKHFGKELLQEFPFIDGSECQLCISSGRKRVAVAKVRANHLKHIGCVHEKVLDLVPSDLRETITSFGKKKNGPHTSEADEGLLDIVSEKYQDLAGGSVINSIKTEPTDSANCFNYLVGPEHSAEAEVNEVPPGMCPFCPNSKTQFQRSSLLIHLSSTHYNKQLLDAFPYEEGKKCQLCVDAGRTNPLIAKSKSRHINHVGSLHEKVLDMLPSKLSLSFNNSRKSTLRQSAKAGGFEEEQPVYNNLNTGPQLKNFRGPVPGPPME